MVTQTSLQSDPTGATIRDRGFVGEQPAMAAEYRANRFMFYPAPFWGPVIAGTLFAFSTFALSWYLMIACSVGVTGHMISLGWGAAVWMWVTSAIAFYVGGAIASKITTPRNFGWLKGAAIWGLSIPLGLVAYAIASGSGVLGAAFLPHGTMAADTATYGGMVNYAFMWAAFITLAIGLIFALFGSMSAGPYRAGIDTVSEKTTEVPLTH